MSGWSLTPNSAGGSLQAKQSRSKKVNHHLWTMATKQDRPDSKALSRTSDTRGVSQAHYYTTVIPPACSTLSYRMAKGLSQACSLCTDTWPAFISIILWPVSTDELQIQMALIQSADGLWESWRLHWNIGFTEANESVGDHMRLLQAAFKHWVSPTEANESIGGSMRKLEAAFKCWVSLT